MSTDSDEQLSSYEAQDGYYTEYINQRSDWEFAGVYADAGITGTNTKHRVEFNRMIEDALLGKFDMIITKSISRFSRNTLDTLKHVRMLKERGISVYFEKENIDTFDTKGEVLLTILSSLAQEESNNLSQVSRWGIVRRFQQGKTRVNHKRFMGYDKDENGELVVNEKEAEIVRRIFEEYLEGKSYYTIAEGLEEDGILTVTGKRKWHDSVIRKMLTNEKYMGDALLQKTITVDFLSHKRIKNEGHVQQFYVEDSHPSIISKETFQKVQEEIARRSKMRGVTDEVRSRYSNKYAFSGKIFCGECGSVFRRVRWGTVKKYQKYVWICKSHRDKGDTACLMKSVDEEKLKEAFVRVANRVMKDSGGFISKMMANIEKVLNESRSSQKIEFIDGKLLDLREQVTNLVRLNTQSGLDRDIYEEEYNRLVLEMDALRKQRSEYTKTEFECINNFSKIKQIEKMLNNSEFISGFDDDIFQAMVERINIKSIVKAEFVLKSGIPVEEIL